MHSYLRSIGFSKITRDRDIFPFLQMTIDTPDLRDSYEKPDGEVFFELKKEFGPRIGIAVCGSYLEDHAFHVEYFYPYFYGEYESENEEIEVDRHADKNSYAAVCDDPRLGITLIYYVQNISEVYRATSGGMYLPKGTSVLSALSIDGKIILPVEQPEASASTEIDRMISRSNLFSAARDGEAKAIENLTMEDMDLYSILSGRLVDEDLLSIIETSMMPFGIESDQYAVVGEIFDISYIKNLITGEMMFVLSINAKDIIYEVCINESDLLGEPQVGRRFKGKIWLQGSIKLQ